MKAIKKHNILKKKDSNLQIQTIEGKSAYEDAISFLEQQEPVSPLTKEIKLLLSSVLLPLLFLL